MNKAKNIDIVTKLMRWLARIIALLIGLIWLSQIPGILSHSTVQLPISIQVLLLCIPMTAAIIALFRETLAGWLYIAGAFILAIFPMLEQLIHGDPFTFKLGMAAFYLTSLVLGLLFIICGRRSRV